MRRHCGECGGMRYFNFGVSLVHHCGSSASCPAGCTEVAKEGVVLPHAPPANSELWATGAIPPEPVVGICGHGNGHAAGTKRSTAAPVPGDRRDGGSAARAVRLCVLGRLSCGAEDRRRADRTLARGRARACLESVRGGRPRVPPRRAVVSGRCGRAHPCGPGGVSPPAQSDRRYRAGDPIDRAVRSRWASSRFQPALSGAAGVERRGSRLFPSSNRASRRRLCRRGSDFPRSPSGDRSILHRQQAQVDAGRRVCRRRAHRHPAGRI